MAAVRHIVPVTPELNRVLLGAEKYIGRIGTRKTNDYDHYRAAVLVLEDLAKALLEAQAAGSLVSPKHDVPRLDVAAGRSVAAKLAEVVAYLGGRASELLRISDRALSRHQSTHTEMAEGYLRALFSLIMQGIYRMATEDLDVMRHQGVATLLEAAEEVAVAAGRTAETEPVSPMSLPAGPVFEG